MMANSVILKSQLEGARRLDAEYYQPGFLRGKELLMNSGAIPLEDIAKIATGPAYSSEEIGDKLDIALARIGDVVNKIEVEDWLKVSRKDFEKFNSRKINNLDILLSMTGDPPDVGKCNLIIVPNGEPLAFNQRVAKLTSKTPFYLFAFLSTEIARQQSERNALGIRQRNLGIDDLRNTLVFIPNLQIVQDNIANLVEAYFAELENSKRCFLGAENLLLEELGLADFKISDDLSWTSNLSDVKFADRIDADHFQPKYEVLVSKLQEKDTEHLIEAIENVPARFNTLAKPNDTYRYVDLGNINSSLGIIDGYEEVLGKEAPSRAKRALKAGDVIVSSVEGSLDKVALVSIDQEGYLASSGFFQFRSKTLLPEILLVIAKSLVLQMQLKKYCAGTILMAVPSDALAKMVIPTISKDVQQKIAGLVRQSHEARKRSKELLEEAKRKVEEMIEKGGEGR